MSLKLNCVLHSRMVSGTYWNPMRDGENYNESFEQLKTQFSDEKGLGEAINRIIFEAPTVCGEFDLPNFLFFNFLGRLYEDKRIYDPEGNCFPYRLLRLCRIIDTNIASFDELIELFANVISNILRGVVRFSCKTFVITI